MFVVLHCFGTLPVKYVFMIMVRGIFNLSLNSFIISFGIEFGPTAILVCAPKSTHRFYLCHF